MVHLEHIVPFDGSFRIFIFARNPLKSSAALRDLSIGLEESRPFYTASQKFQHSAIDRLHIRSFCTVVTVFAAERSRVDIARDVPGILTEWKDHILPMTALCHRARYIRRTAKYAERKQKLL